METEKYINIIAEFEIKEDIKEIRIINSYEDRREYTWIRYKVEYRNEKEIKENCEIRINNEIIPFSYKYKFNKKGKYIIKYLFNKNITKINFLFRDCSSLTNINLSNFNTKNVTDMSWMFSDCSSLTNKNIITNDQRIM